MFGAGTSGDRTIVAVITVRMSVEPDDDGGHEANDGERPDDEVACRGQGEQEQADRHKQDRSHEPPQEPPPPRTHEELIIRPELKTDPARTNGWIGLVRYTGVRSPPIDEVRLFHRGKRPF